MKITFTELDGNKIEYNDVMTFEVDINSVKVFYFNKDIDSLLVDTRTLDGGTSKMEVDFTGYHDGLLSYIDRLKEYALSSKKFFEEVRLPAWRKKDEIVPDAHKLLL